MAADQLPKRTNTVVVGTGPSALILSYILHGHIPYYNPARPHPDSMIHQKLSRSLCLLNIDVEDLTSHFTASRIPYSTQTLPVNVLLDTVLRPLADTNPGQHESCVEWHYEAEKRVDHIVVGTTFRPGGQWADNPVSASWDSQALSYAEQLDLPGYSFFQHRQSKICNNDMCDFYRPTRREFADYLAIYPTQVGITDSIYSGVAVSGVSRTANGFHIASHNMECKNLVLASGVSSHLIPPRPLLKPLRNLPHKVQADEPLLVLGSGFTAADIISSAPCDQKIFHIYKWDPDNAPSPLRACHRSAYPEYASIYRRMKLAARCVLGPGVVSPLRYKKSNPFFETRESQYEGFPNTLITNVSLHSKTATVRLRRGDGQEMEREISGFECVIGRRGSLTYLDKQLRQQCLTGGQGTAETVSCSTLKHKIDSCGMEIAPNMFAIGSLAGDTLIRFAYGGCVMAAGNIISQQQQQEQQERQESVKETPEDQLFPALDSINEDPHLTRSFNATLKTLLSNAESVKQNHSGCDVAGANVGTLSSNEAPEQSGCTIL